ncbi:MAG: ParA family protein [bacterium]|nr:ParA family protein [bacterium]
MSVVISCAIQKGGTGKSTTVATTAHALGELGYKVLAVDSDPQSNLSMILGKVKVLDQPRTMIDLFTDDGATFSNCATPSKYKNVDLISSSIDLFSVVEKLGSGHPKNLIGLQRKLDTAAKNHYDYILIDCPPALFSPLVSNALVISDYYIIPLEAESYFGLKGVQQFLEAAQVIKDGINSNLSLLGVLVTRADMRTHAAQAMTESIQRFFGPDKVFKTVVHRNTAIAKASMSHQTVIGYDSRMSGAKDYRNFAKELVEWIKREQEKAQL